MIGLSSDDDVGKQSQVLHEI